MTDAPFDSLGKLFIAGTGRSGTTILYRILSRHPDAFAVPIETKFIAEGDGLNALLPALHENYSIMASHLAFGRFIEMMDGDFEESEAYQSSKESIRLYERFDRRYYFPPLRKYINELTDFHFAGYRYPKRFADRAELIALTRQFVGSLFGDPALAAGKSFWVEKTPLNLIAMDLLWDLFPEATIVHIKRHPCAVLYSFLLQDWLPRGLEDCTRFLANVYWRWMTLKARLDFSNRRYVEIKLEDLASRPVETMATVASVAGIRNTFKLNDLKIEAVDYWERDMPPEWRRHAEKELAPYFELMDYRP